VRRSERSPEREVLRRRRRKLVRKRFANWRTHLIGGLCFNK